MRYRVHGTSRSTGAPATLRVEAKNHEAARAIAAQHLVVAQVEPEGGLAEPEIFERPEELRLEDLVEATESQGKSLSKSGAKYRRIIAIGLAFIGALAIVLLAMWFRARRR